MRLYGAHIVKSLWNSQHPLSKQEKNIKKMTYMYSAYIICFTLKKNHWLLTIYALTLKYSQYTGNFLSSTKKIISKENLSSDEPEKKNQKPLSLSACTGKMKKN